MILTICLLANKWFVVGFSPTSDKCIWSLNRTNANFRQMSLKFTCSIAQISHIYFWSSCPFVWSSCPIIWTSHRNVQRSYTKFLKFIRLYAKVHVRLFEVHSEISDVHTQIFENHTPNVVWSSYIYISNNLSVANLSPSELTWLNLFHTIFISHNGSLTPETLTFDNVAFPNIKYEWAKALQFSATAKSTFFDRLNRAIARFLLYFPSSLWSCN